MELYVYECSDGSHVADFRPYLDGRDHSFDDHRPLDPEDPRWEKIRSLKDPTYGDDLGPLRFVGRAATKWHELMVFPIKWDAEFEPEEWEEQATAS